MPATRYTPTASQTLNAAKDDALDLELAADGSILITGLKRHECLVVPQSNVAWFEPYPEEKKKRRVRKKKDETAADPAATEPAETAPPSEPPKELSV